MKDMQKSPINGPVNAEKAETWSSTGLSKGISLACVLCSVFTIKHKPQALLFIQMFCFIV